MTTSEAVAAAKSDFLAAEEIKGILRGRERGEQERIMRWVSESLELPVSHARPRLGAAGGLPEAHPQVGQVASQDERPRPKDIRSFVAEKQPKSDIHFVTVVAYYHRFIAPEEARKEAITSDDLQAAARLAGHPVFKAPSVTLNNAVQQGYIDRPARGEYRLNAVGENLVAMTLPGAAQPRANGTRRAKSKRKGSSKVSAARSKKTPRAT